MKQLLTILLLFPLFIACSSDDDDKNTMTDTEKESFLVGGWDNIMYKMDHQDQTTTVTIYIFYQNNTYMSSSKWKKYQGGDTVYIPSDTPMGTYFIRDGKLYLDDVSYSFEIKNKHDIKIGGNIYTNADFKHIASGSF